MSLKHRRGFTLIELLVVILIIAILAAVALPQYNKVIVKSRNAEMKAVVKAVIQAEQAYYLANGKYAANFNELDIDLPLTPVKTKVGGRTGACNTTVQGTDSSRQGPDYYVALNNNSNTNMNWVNVVAYWHRGNYTCAGFGFAQGATAATTRRLHCREMRNTSYYKADTGAFCEKIEQGTYEDQNDSWRRYSLP